MTVAVYFMSCHLVCTYNKARRICADVSLLSSEDNQLLLEAVFVVARAAISLS